MSSYGKGDVAPAVSDRLWLQTNAQGKLDENGHYISLGQVPENRCKEHVFLEPDATHCTCPKRVTHELKAWPEPFQAVLDGRKRHEIRKNDRNFKVGDGLLLREWLPTEKTYSGRELVVSITFISSGESLGLTSSTCVLSISNA